VRRGTPAHREKSLDRGAPGPQGRDSGCRGTGERRVIGLELAARDDDDLAWTAFVRGLVKCGLPGVRLAFRGDHARSSEPSASSSWDPAGDAHRCTAPGAPDGRLIRSGARMTRTSWHSTTATTAAVILTQSIRVPWPTSGRRAHAGDPRRRGLETSSDARSCPLAPVWSSLRNPLPVQRTRIET